jgi:methionyl-tRNA synthetase
VGEIIACEEHPDSDKLLISKVQIGPEIRTIVSGLRPKFKPSDLIGKKVVVVVNLKPAKLRGVMSEGMLLVAEDDKELELLTLQKSASGSIIR